MQSRNLSQDIFSKKTLNPCTDSEHGQLTVQEAGRFGGLATLRRHGIDHYRRAGRKGQAKLAARFGKAQRRRWGAMGGRPKRVRFTNMGEKKQCR
ncbi:MAG: hypothetical protein ACE5LA_02785 [Dehalococcoidales bacterium]